MPSAPSKTDVHNFLTGVLSGRGDLVARKFDHILYRDIAVVKNSHGSYERIVAHVDPEGRICATEDAFAPSAEEMIRQLVEVVR